MAEDKISKFDMSPVEPAHPMVVKMRDDLAAIYNHLKEKYQIQIDQGFDRVSRQIGFVVTTTLPIVFNIGRDNAVKSISMGAEHLEGTLFDKQMTRVLKPLMDEPLPLNSKLEATNYNLYLLWFEALKLKLRADWMEPAHFRPWVEPAHIYRYRAKAEAVIPRPWEEPAHWFDPGIVIAAEEAVLISVIDEVYPELRLADRVKAAREPIPRKLMPGVREPAHIRLEPGSTEVLSELAAVLRRYGY